MIRRADRGGDARRSSRSSTARARPTRSRRSPREAGFARGASGSATWRASSGCCVGAAVTRRARRGRSARASPRGGVAVFPADTVYGLACDPENAAAVARLYALKGRPPDKPAAVMFFDLDELRRLRRPAARAASTLLLPNPSGASRSPARPTRRRSACACRSWRPVGRPVLQSARTSPAGPTRGASTTCRQAIRDGADLVLDGGELPGTPSTVIDLRTPEWRIVRQGAVSAQRVERRAAQEPLTPRGRSGGEARGAAMRRSWVIAACAAGLSGSGRARRRRGGPVPPVLERLRREHLDRLGELRARVAGRARDTIIQRVIRNGGVIERTPAARRASYGIPGAAVDGSTTGLSADGRTLVLAESHRPCPGPACSCWTRENLRARKRIALPEFVSVDAISPDGRTLYVAPLPEGAGGRPGRTRSWRLDLRTGRLRGDPIMDPREPDEQMGGIPLTRDDEPRQALGLHALQRRAQASSTRSTRRRARRAASTSRAAISLRPAADARAVRRCTVGDLATIDLAHVRPDRRAGDPGATPRPTATPAPAAEHAGGLPLGCRWPLGLVALAAVAAARPPVRDAPAGAGRDLGTAGIRTCERAARRRPSDSLPSTA